MRQDQAFNNYMGRRRDVGRKTANCALGAAFDVPGMVVDTHVKRLAIKMGFAENSNPDKIEEDIMKIKVRG
jgi:endonuclease III